MNRLWTSIIAVLVVMSLLGAGLTATPSGSDIVSGQSTSADEPTITFANQTSNGSTVTIQNATLPEGGFIAIHDSEYLSSSPADLTVLATSDYLSPGQHQNVTINISNAPPGNYPGVNTTSLNTTQTLVGALYSDSNGNRQFDYVLSGGSEDSAVEVDGNPVRDVGQATISNPEPEYASAVFQDQTLENNILVVSQAYLPNGGFVTVHNRTYQQTGDPLASNVGLSEYLSPGNHSNITVRVLPNSLSQSQTVTLRLAMDTNNNQQYDYVTSDGFNDTGYSAANKSQVVTETAQVQVRSTQPVSSESPTSTTAGAFSQQPATDLDSDTPAPTNADASTPTTTDNSAGSFLDTSFIWRALGTLVLVVVIILFIRVVR